MPRRQVPGPMERASISDAEGYPVLLDRLPSAADHAGWEVVTSPATDREGWQYGSVFRCADMLPLELGEFKHRSAKIKAHLIY